MNPTKLMASGQLVSIVRPDPKTIRFSDICDTLERTYRHGGQSGSNVSVAHHICLGLATMRWLGYSNRLIQLWLMHDMHEYLIGEVITPMKQALRIVAGFDVVGLLEADIDLVLYEIAGIRAPNRDEHLSVKYIDHAICLWEVKHIVGLDWRNYGLDVDLLGIAESALDRDSADVTDAWGQALATAVQGHLPRLFEWEGGDAEHHHVAQAVAMMETGAPA